MSGKSPSNKNQGVRSAANKASRIARNAARKTKGVMHGNARRQRRSSDVKLGTFTGDL